MSFSSPPLCYLSIDANQKDFLYSVLLIKKDYYQGSEERFASCFYIGHTRSSHDPLKQLKYSILQVRRVQSGAQDHRAAGGSTGIQTSPLDPRASLLPQAHPALNGDPRYKDLRDPPAI